MDLLDFCGISIHAPRTGSDLQLFAEFFFKFVFQSTLPARGATDTTLLLIVGMRHDFNPRSPHGERQLPFVGSSCTGRFQSTLPARGATRCNLRTMCVRRYFNPRSPHGERLALCCSRHMQLYFNPRSPHGERQQPQRAEIMLGDISIHAPRTGSDVHVVDFPLDIGISIHAPRTGSDLALLPHPTFRLRFQSTLPARGATMQLSFFPTRQKISIHAPRTGSDHKSINNRFCPYISIHAPRTGSDEDLRTPHSKEGDFNPRSPHGERPQQCYMMRTLILISIHAPRTGSDKYERKYGVNCIHFNPRSPHGERLYVGSHSAAYSAFQSTLPARGATRSRR